MFDLFPSRVKVCGITNLDDALAALDCGVRTLGFVFYPPSPRAIAPEQAQQIIAALPQNAICVGVFVDEPPEQVQRIASICGLKAAQWHGSEPNSWLAQARLPAIKAFRARPGTTLDLGTYPAATAYLIDAWSPSAAGGTGQRWDWASIDHLPLRGKPLVLAGGLTLENLAEAIKRVRPQAVDVSSGVEREPGRKDHHKMRGFVAAAAAAYAEEGYRDIEQN